MALVESLKIILTKAGRNDNSGAHQEQSLICGELVSEVPVRPGHLQTMPPLIWPPLLSELVDVPRMGSFLVVSLSLAIQVLLKAM